MCWPTGGSMYFLSCKLASILKMSRCPSLSDFGTFQWSSVRNRTFDEQVDTMNTWWEKLMGDKEWSERDGWIFESKKSQVSIYSLLVVPPNANFINYKAQVMPVKVAANSIKSYIDDQSTGHKICIMTSDWKYKGKKYFKNTGHTQALVIEKRKERYVFLIFHSFYRPQLEYRNRKVINRFIHIFQNPKIYHCIQPEYKVQNRNCFPSSIRFIHQVICENDEKTPKIIFK